MSLLYLIILLVIVGVVLWLVNTYIPMDPTIKKIITIVVIVAVCLWLLSLFAGYFPNIPVGRGCVGRGC